MKNTLITLFAAASLLLSGCATVAPKPAEIRAEGDVRLSGRLSVQVAGSTGRASGGNAGFELSGNPRAGQLELSTPLGSLLARASWGPGEAMLQTPGAERSFSDLDALTRELLGEAIPVAALFDWLRGHPWPQTPSEIWQDGVGFSQLGWRIDLAGLQDGLIVATRSAEPAVTLRARVEP
ncbi:outer membrane lipoprotein LolB [Paucibacter sp. TC2R-5]|uniref:lipoprotein insertase outer membrane protein LolB n=1 Tax=Paucibacter sp. TC2R-5 TaxID=2893555 RepID=UPI0021E42711|nr:lipoprotein insertase outer membrane protein LolB [Paucibacter sp. TC2R-5]MCV2359616.1 outer membrane lipoprotein LolB [Paucibacter sp. TC2R-5]